MGGVITRRGGDTCGFGVVERDRGADSEARWRSGDGSFLNLEQGDMDDFDLRSVLHVLADPRRDMKARGDAAAGGGVADSERFAMLERRLYAGVENS